MKSFRTKVNGRRAVYLALSGQIEGQLREAYGRKYSKGLITQSGLANKLGVNRSAINRRLVGKTNMTIETIADMVWGLDQAIKVTIYDPATERGDNKQALLDPTLLSNSNTATVAPTTVAPTANTNSVVALPGINAFGFTTP